MVFKDTRFSEQGARQFQEPLLAPVRKNVNLAVGHPAAILRQHVPDSLFHINTGQAGLSLKGCFYKDVMVHRAFALILIVLAKTLGSKGRYSILVTGCWLLVAGFWQPVAGSIQLLVKHNFEIFALNAP